jgi:hypothetical protein
MRTRKRTRPTKRTRCRRKIKGGLIGKSIPPMSSRNPLKQKILRESNKRLLRDQIAFDRAVNYLNEENKILRKLLQECEQNQNINSFEDINDNYILDKLEKSTEKAPKSYNEQIKDIQDSQSPPVNSRDNT